MQKSLNKHPVFPVHVSLHVHQRKPTALVDGNKKNQRIRHWRHVTKRKQKI